MIISVDHGNKFLKLTGNRSFTSGLRESDSRPPFGEDFLKYRGKYYMISNQRIPYQRNKANDNRFYILTLYAICKEIEDSGQYTNDLMNIKLLVGLPPAHYGTQYERFQEYFMSGEVEEIEFRNKKFTICIDEVSAFPQAYAAAITIFKEISSYPKVVVIDIGGITVDYLIINNGDPVLSACDSLENGIIMLYNQVISRVNSALDLLLDEADIDTILKGETDQFSEDVKELVNNAAQIFLSDIFGKLRERAIDLRSSKVVFVGGGSILLKDKIEMSDKITSPIFIEDISANANGYELLNKATKATG
jgi:plasmid segregation protein ParM